MLGCTDCQDNINHYMQCSPLWQIACSALGVTDPFNFSMRLCIVSPTVGNAQLLALVFAPYHSAHSMFKGGDVISPMPRVVQQNLVQAAKAFRHHINGWCCIKYIVSFLAWKIYIYICIYMYISLYTCIYICIYPSLFIYTCILAYLYF